MKTLVIFLAFIFFPGCASYADHVPDNRAILAIIGEAENQGSEGMLAVACGIRNRGTLKGVYGEKAPRVVKKLYSQSIYDRAKIAWTLANENNDGTSDDYCSFLDGADHWENIKAFGEPSWASKMVKTYEYKDHAFYRARGK